MLISDQKMEVEVGEWSGFADSFWQRGGIGLWLSDMVSKKMIVCLTDQMLRNCATVHGSRYQEGITSSKSWFGLH